MKSILYASNPSNNNQLSVGSQIKRHDSSINDHYQNLNSRKATESFTDPSDIKLFSSSKKQVIRNICSAKSDADKLKRADVWDGCKNITNDTAVEQQQRFIKLQASDNNLELESLESQPLIVDNNIPVESETQLSGKSVRLINLRKKNGTTLIFQKKTNTQKLQKANEYQELESSKKRRSLQQWSDTDDSDIVTSKTVRHSWFNSDQYVAKAEDLDKAKVRFHLEVQFCDRLE